VTSESKQINIDIVLKPENIKALLEGKKITSSGHDDFPGVGPADVTVIVEMPLTKTNPGVWMEMASAASKAAMVDFATTAILDIEKEIATKTGVGVDLVGALDVIRHRMSETRDESGV
jgi:hypothetical protein